MSAAASAKAPLSASPLKEVNKPFSIFLEILVVLVLLEFLDYSSLSIFSITTILLIRKKRASHFCKALYLIWRLPTFPLGVAVSSATQGLTSLFEMVKGVHLLYNHQKYL